MARVWEYGVTYSQVGKGESPAGGWPQITQIYGREANYYDMRKAQVIFRTQFDLHIEDTNKRLEPILGFIPFPDMKHFYGPKNIPD